jgi:hypothetical protein
MGNQNSARKIRNDYIRETNGKLGLVIYNEHRIERKRDNTFVQHYQIGNVLDDKINLDKYVPISEKPTKIPPCFRGKRKNHPKH